MSPIFKVQSVTWLFNRLVDELCTVHCTPTALKTGHSIR